MLVQPQLPGFVAPVVGTGIFPSQTLRAMIESGNIFNREDENAVYDKEGINPDQVQPASLDLRLGNRAYRVRASFLPGGDRTVMECIEQLDGLPEIDLTKGVVLERGAVYVAELLESVKLSGGIEGTANPKSSTGRIDVLTRLVTDCATRFDYIRAGYKGPLYVEIAPLTFPVVVRRGIRLNQARFHRGKPIVTKKDLEQYFDKGELLGGDVHKDEFEPWHGLPVTIDLRGTGTHGVVGYRAKKNTNKIDMANIGHYDPSAFWDKIESTNGRINLDKDDFYILATQEDVGVPPQLAGEMVPYDTNSGEFRVHYAGFFDPGFGRKDGRTQGSKAVLEVRSHGVPFTLEDGQIVGRLRYFNVAGGAPDSLYGAGVKSNYQGQGLALAKFFSAWPE